MRFTKMHGTGNDFVVLEPGDRQLDWSELAIAMCDRHYGIGADSLLLLLPSDKAHFQMRIFDCDGSEAEACGNGLRCLVKCFVDGRRANSEIREILVETIAGVRSAEIYRASGEVTKVKSGMGTPKFREKDIPLVIEAEARKDIVDIKSMIEYPVDADGNKLALDLVSMGNPHAVYFSQEAVSGFPLSRLGPRMENLAIFTNRVNFEVARVVNRQRIEARVWERGVGETLACGSGACAITVAARLHDYVDNKVAIVLPGGVLEVEWDGIGEVYLSGPAETVFTGDWPD